MERALFAALSLNEEITLRRISYGIVAAMDLNKSDIERLKALALAQWSCAASCHAQRLVDRRSGRTAP